MYFPFYHGAWVGQPQYWLCAAAALTWGCLSFDPAVHGLGLVQQQATVPHGSISFNACIPVQVPSWLNLTGTHSQYAHASIWNWPSESSPAEPAIYCSPMYKAHPAARSTRCVSMSIYSNPTSPLLERNTHFVSPYASAILLPTDSPLQYAPVAVPSPTNGAVCSPANHSPWSGRPSLMVRISVSPSSSPTWKLL